MKTIELTRRLKNPVAAALLAGVEVAGTAVAFGVGETVLAIAAAYFAFQSLEGQRKRDRTIGSPASGARNDDGKAPPAR